MGEQNTQQTINLGKGDNNQEGSTQGQQTPEGTSRKTSEKANKKKSKTIGYAAAYIGKGGHTQVLQGSSERKKDAERKLKEHGVSEDNMRVTPIKE